MIDVLVFGAHPDDIEFGCGAILAKMAAQGRKIAMVDLSLGDKATHGTPEIRQQESLAAAHLIGASRIFLDFLDCEIVDTYENRLKLVKVIRQWQPRLVLAPMWKGEQNHPDHTAAGQMLRYACRYARLPKILPELPIHRVEGILHYLYPTYDHADFLIDITEYVEVWKKMMACHQSQMKTKPYSEINLRMASKLGTYIDRPYAQGLAKGNPILIEDLMSIAKGTMEI